MITPHDGADHTGNGSHLADDQPSSTIPADEYIVGGPGCHLCSAMKKDVPSRSLEKQTPNLQRVLQRLHQQRHILWRDPGSPG